MAFTLPLNPAALAIAAATAIGVAAPAAAEEAVVLGCSERSEIIAHLDERYGEVLTGAPRAHPAGELELFLSDSGSWTMILTTANGQSCPVAAGVATEDDLRRMGLHETPV